jgi:hypothetical protein
MVHKLSPEIFFWRTRCVVSCNSAKLKKTYDTTTNDRERAVHAKLPNGFRSESSRLAWLHD